MCVHIGGHRLIWIEIRDMCGLGSLLYSDIDTTNAYSINTHQTNETRSIHT